MSILDSETLSLWLQYIFRESVAGLRTFLLEQTAAGGDRQVLAYVTDLLNKQVGFLLNERYVNIPAQVINPSSWSVSILGLNFQVTVPLLETLVTEMRKATDRNLPFNFSHYIMICKLFKTKSESAQDHQVNCQRNLHSKPISTSILCFYSYGDIQSRDIKCFIIEFSSL